MMKKKFHLPLKKAATIAMSLAIGALLWGAPTPVQATGVDAANSESYNESNRPDFPAFNALEGKQNFLTVETEDGKTFTGGVDTLELVAGQTYTVKIAYCNDALPRGVPNAAYAHGAKVRSQLPDLVDGEQNITATLSAVDTRPAEVNCTLAVTSEVPLILDLVPSSARIHNANKTDNNPVSASDLLGSGADFGTNSMTGIVLYGEEYAGYIEYSFTTALSEQDTAQADSVQSESASTIIDIAPDKVPEKSAEDVPLYLYLLLAVAVILLIVAIGYWVYYSIERRNRRYRR